MPTLFSAIIHREAPAHLVWDDGQVVAFLDARPRVPGHALVVPYREIDQWTDLSDIEAEHIFSVVRRIGRAQIAAFGSPRAGVVIAGFHVPHVHVHVFPAKGTQDFDFRELPGPAGDRELRLVAGKLRGMALRLGELDANHIVES